MSRGALDIALYDLDQTEETLASFVADPEAFASGHDLSEEERVALTAWDHETLYALGAHPFLLLQAVRSLAMHRGEPVAETLTAYREAVARHGHPDFVT